MDVGPARLAVLLGDVREADPPVYAALADRLRLLVADGRVAVGVRLPAERELATSVGVSRATVTAAYRRLREAGWASARQGAGTFTRLPGGPPGTADREGSWVPAPVEAGVLDLAHAAPSAPPQVPAAFAVALQELPRLLPGHGYHPGGLPELRARIAARYTARGLPTDVEQVLVTSGALHGVSLALEVLVGPGDRVLVEHPSYPNALDAVTGVRARPVPVPVDAGDPESLVTDLVRAARQVAPRAAYVMPDFQNPTGLLLDDGQRGRLASGLHRAGVTAVVDETLVDLPVDGADMPPPFATRSPSAVTVGTLSKSVWGGLRVGWLRGPADVVARATTAATRTQLSLPVLEQLAACHLLDTLDQADGALVLQRRRLRAQRDALVAALARDLPDWRVLVPSGGLVLWCALPAPVSTSLAVSAASRGLRLAAGPRFGTGHAFEDRLRLPYTHPPDVLDRAVRLLADAAGDVVPAARPATSTRLVV